MTPVLLFAPLLAPAIQPATPEQGDGAAEVAGLFGLLLAGPEPLQANLVVGEPPLLRPRPAMAGAFAAPVTVPPPGPHVGARAAGSVIMSPAAVAAPLAAATAPATPVPADPAPAAAPSIGEAGSQVPAATEGAARVRTPPVLLSILDDRSRAVGQAPGNAALPAPAVATIREVRPVGQASGTPIPDQVIRPRVALPAAADTRTTTEQPRPSGAPRGATHPAGGPRASAFSTGLSHAFVAAPPDAGRPNPPGFASPSAQLASTTDQPWLTDQGRLEPTLDGVEAAPGRSEPSATEALRPPAPGRAAPPPPMVQIGVHIAKAAPAGIDRLFVHLEPAALGRVEVRLEFHRDNHVSAVIAAERPDTLDALQRDARLLERSLHDAGLRLDSDGLTFSLKREQAQEQASEHDSFAPPADDLGERVRPPATDHGAPPQWFGALRVLDIRI